MLSSNEDEGGNMAIQYLGQESTPTYLALSSDMSSASTIAGASCIGKTVYLSDTEKWYIVSASYVESTSALKLEPFLNPKLQS